MSRTGALLRWLAFTTALPIAFAVVAVVYSTVSG